MSSNRLTDVMASEFTAEARRLEQEAKSLRARSQLLIKKSRANTKRAKDMRVIASKLKDGK